MLYVWMVFLCDMVYIIDVLIRGSKCLMKEVIVKCLILIVKKFVLVVIVLFLFKVLIFLLFYVLVIYELDEFMLYFLVCLVCLFVIFIFGRLNMVFVVLR